MNYDPVKAHNYYIHKRNSNYYKMLYVIGIANIIEERGCSHKEANRIYFDRINKLKRCYADV
jgi:hypothetical protein